MPIDRKQLRTTLPRIVGLVATTVVVFYVVVPILLFSSEGQDSLLPPWPLFAGEAICVAIVLFLALGPRKLEKGSSILLSAVTLSMILTGLAVYVWGLGATWSLSSAIGKTIAAFLSFSYPVILPTFAILLMRKRNANAPAIAAVALGACLLLTLPLVVVAVMLVCVLTGDCL